LSALTLITQRYSNGPSSIEPADQIARTGQSSGEKFQPFGSNGFTFADLIDIINPLQHIPILSNIYRKLSGDTIDPAARIAGGTLFGGPIGAALAVAETAFKEFNESKKSTLPSNRFEEDPSASKQIAGAQTAPTQAVIAKSASPEIKDSYSQNDSPSNKVTTLRGGWIVNAAYQGKPSALFEWAKNPASEHSGPLSEKTNIVMHRPAQVPGGWLVNAAYQGRANPSYNATSAGTAMPAINVRS
jgi:hypothetical protein